MITVRIVSETRDIADASESWITQSINRRRKDNVSVCVEVVIDTSGANLRLATPACATGASGGGFRPPNANERELIDLWNSRGLNSPDFAAGNLVAFLKQVWKAAA